MLTVQAQNQDPLNPMDSTEFAVQLATFSSVEQQVLTNDLLKSLSANITGNDLSQLANWVGMDVRAAAPAVFDGNPIYVETAPVANASSAQLRVYDETGQLWDQFSIDTAPGPLIWEGTRDDGTRFPDGVYSFDVVSFDADGEAINTNQAQTYNRVVEAQAGSDGAQLLLGNGLSIPSASVTALR